MAAPATDAEIAAALRIAADDPRLATLSPALSDWLDSRIGLSPVPATVKKEAFIRLVAYIYDMPESAGSAGWSRPFVNSGSAALLAPYLIQGASILTADAQGVVAGASIQGAYVNAVALDGSILVVTFSNGAEVRLALPAGQGGTVADGSIGIDQLSSAVVETLNNSVPHDGVTISGNVLTFASEGSGSTNITLPVRTDAEIRAEIEAALVAGANITITPAGSGASKTFTVAASGTGGAGLNRAAVDGRIDALVPPARRVPAYAVGDAGEVLKVASDGNSLAFEPEATGGAGNKLSVLSALPAVAGYSLRDIINVSGELFELVASATAQNVISGLNSGAPSGYTGDTTFQWDETSQNIRLYIPRAWISSAPSFLYVVVQTDTGLYDKTVLGRAQADDASNTRWAYHRNPSDAAIIEDADATRYSVTLYSDAAYKTPFNLTGRNTNHWQPDARNQLTAAAVEEIIAGDVDATALSGNTDRWPKAKLPVDTQYGTGGSSARISATELMDGPGVGLGIAGSSTDRTGNFGSFTTNLDLDETDNQHGIIEVEATVTISSASSTTLGFDQVTASPDRENRQTGFAFVSTVRAADEYSRTSVTGVSVASWTVYNGSATLGVLTLYLERATGTNNLGYSIRWDGQSGSLSWSFGITLNVVFLPTDAPDVPTSSGGNTYTIIGAWAAPLGTSRLTYYDWEDSIYNAAIANDVRGLRFRGQTSERRDSRGLFQYGFTGDTWSTFEREFIYPIFPLGRNYGNPPKLIIGSPENVNPFIWIDGSRSANDKLRTYYPQVITGTFFHPTTHIETSKASRWRFRLETIK